MTEIEKNLKIASNLMKMQLKKELQDLDDEDTRLSMKITSLSDKTKKIAMSYASEFIAEDKPIREFFEALQGLRMADPCILDDEEFDARFDVEDGLLVPESFVAWANIVTRNTIEYRFDLEFMRFGNNYYGGTIEIEFPEDEQAVIDEYFETKRLNSINNRLISEAKKKQANQEDVLLRVETEMLISEVGADSAALSIVGNLISKHMSGALLELPKVGDQ